MARYPLSLPINLKQEAEVQAAHQGVSLNQFILWAVAEKVGGLRQALDDPHFPLITYCGGAGGQPTPVVRGTNIRVQTIVVASRRWQLTPVQIGDDYDLSPTQVKEALAFYRAHESEIEAAIVAEQLLETARDQAPATS